MAADDPDIVLLHERVLVDRARHGDRAAFAELYRRQAPAAWRLALAVSRQPHLAREAVIAGFAAVLAENGRARPDRHEPLRTQILTATRHAVIDGDPEATHSLSLMFAEPEVEAPLPAELAVAMQAYESLPERWRSVLWLTEVEGLPADHAAAVLDMSADGASPLAERALAGLRERFVQAEATRAADPDCVRTIDRLDRYSSGSLPARESTRIRRHLDACEGCRDRLLAVDDLMPRLRRAAPAVPLLLFAEAEERWRGAAVITPGPLHVTLPGGRMAPAWAERALAGAAATIITIGITGAILAGGRDKARDDRLARQASSGEPVGTDDIGAADGESALGGGGDLPLVVPGGGSATPPASPGLPVVEIGDALVIERPSQSPLPSDQGTRTPPATGGPSAPGSPGPAPIVPPVTDPDPASPAAPGTPLQVTVEVEDVASVAVGECTGVELLGTPLLCDPATVDEDDTLDLIEDVVEPLLGDDVVAPLLAPLGL